MPTPRQIERRQRVLKISREFFSLHGFQETTLDEIARKAHVGKGIIYRYFGDKEDLLVAVFADTFEGIQAAAKDYPNPVAPTVEERFRIIIRNYLQHIDSQRDTLAFFGKILIGLPGTPWGLGLRQEFMERYFKIANRRIPALEEEMKKGFLTPLDAEKLIFLITGTTYGIIAWWIRQGCPPGLSDEADTIADYSLHGILTEKGRSQSAARKSLSAEAGSGRKPL